MPQACRARRRRAPPVTGFHLLVVVGIAGSLFIHGFGVSAAAFAALTAERLRPQVSAMQRCTMAKAGILPSLRSAQGGLSPVAMQGFQNVRELTADEIMYKALTRINIRTQPDIRSMTLAQADAELEKLGKQRPNKDKGWTYLEEGQYFEIEQAYPATDDIWAEQGMMYLKLFGQDGWVFTVGIAGEWAGKSIVEKVPADMINARRIESVKQTVTRKLGDMLER
eukprot:TRINITY_DN14108_c0_g1_i1.p1 TRINITY_DN14108_c0_g1~~TRINITY_DN14108_c0_g1_i1.p1  ORF type:complete len:224 (-),score=59.30 TRINITY_DN14108_c0_g1_i1:191-862(-)